jgi:ribosomal protein S18 acetylase RimI-like enzyme
MTSAVDGAGPPPRDGRSTGDVAVRRLRDDESEAWRDLRLRALRTDPGAFGSTAEREERCSEAEWRQRTDALATSSAAAMFVVEERGVLLGCTGLHGDGGGAMTVVSVWIAPAWRGLGLAGRLMEAAASWARGQGASHLTLLVIADNEAARRTYVRAGFRPTGVAVPLPRDPSVTELEMILPLQAMPQEARPQ